ncbi:MAG TPA: hypothetical protein VMR49_02390 [Candidatus Paceibacterota bacterium]|jgi:hypothetical protein|nr:hypothetical protein [Candidatus Paceibacterota bacterium]
MAVAPKVAFGQNNNREYAFVMLSGIIDIQYVMNTPDGPKPFMILNVEKYGKLDDPEDDTTKNVIVKLEYTDENYKALRALQSEFKPFWILYEKVSLRAGNYLPVGKGDDGDNLVYAMGEPVKFDRKCKVTVRDMQKYFYSRLDYLVPRKVWFKHGFWGTKKYFFQIEATKVLEVDNGQRIFKNEVLYVPDTKDNRKKLITQSMENSFFLNTYVLYTTQNGCIDIEPKKNAIPINVVTNFSPIPGNTGNKDNKLFRVNDPWDRLAGY